jgi:hypothetical protein
LTGKHGHNPGAKLFWEVGAGEEALPDYIRDVVAAKQKKL